MRDTDHEVDVGVEQIFGFVDQRVTQPLFGGLVVEHIDCVVGNP